MTIELLATIDLQKQQLDKYKNVIDKIKEYCEEEKEDLIAGGEVCEDILELLEEVE